MLQERLLSFKNKINESEEMDSEFDRLVGVKLFDLIREKEPLKKEFDGRLFYYKNLAESVAVKQIQNKIFEAIKNILELTSVKEIQKIHSWPKSFINVLKTRNGELFRLPELYKLFLDKNNYYQLEDFKNITSQTWAESPINQQYKFIIIIIDLISADWIPDNKKMNKYNELIEKLNQALLEFNEVAYRKAVKLNVKSFENLFQYFASKNEISGYRNLNPITFDIKQIKNICNAVIDDLIEAIPDNKPPVVNEKIINQTGKTLITRDKATGDFYYKDKLVKFQNKDAIYFLIFEYLYENCDYDGFCSYEDIDHYLVKKNMGECADERKVKDRIKNGITNLFRFSSLPSKIPTGKNLIDKARGKGLVINNPVV